MSNATQDAPKTDAPDAPKTDAPDAPKTDAPDAKGKGRPKAKTDYAKCALATVEGLGEVFVGRDGDDKDAKGAPVGARQCAFTRAYIAALEAQLAPDIRVVLMPEASTFKAEKVAIPQPVFTT